MWANKSVYTSLSSKDLIECLSNMTFAFNLWWEMIKEGASRKTAISCYCVQVKSCAMKTKKSLYCSSLPPCPSPGEWLQETDLDYKQLERIQYSYTSNASCGHSISLILFIFACTGSFVVVLRLFLVGASNPHHSSCGVQASHCSSFSCCGAQALGCMGFSGCSTWAQ